MRFHFNDYVLDPGRRELLRMGNRVALEPQVFDLLLYLLNNRDRVVSKDELIEAVWGGRIVSNATIDSRVKAARQAVRDSGGAQTVIRTLPRKGLHFVAEVCEGKDPTITQPATSRTIPESRLPATITEKPSIAVMAFTDMSSDQDQEFFSDGVADDILTELSRDQMLFVIARNSSFTYKKRSIDARQIGLELGVRYVLTGGVRREQNRIRITTQLTNAGSNSTIWAERYDCNNPDMFALLDEISKAICQSICAEIFQVEQNLALRKSPSSLDAWEAYQRALWHFSLFTVEDNRKAQEFLQRSIQLDPAFSRAYQALAFTYLDEVRMYVTRTPEEATATAEELTRKAIMLDPHDGGAQTMLGYVLATRGDLSGGLALAERGVALNCNCALAYYVQAVCLIYSGHHRKGEETMMKFLRLSPRDPLQWRAWSQITAARYLAQNYEGAVTAGNTSIQARPDQRLSYRWLIAALGQLGRQQEALQVIQGAVIAIAPTTFDDYVNKHWPWDRKEDHEHMLVGLRQAGWCG